MLKIKEGYLPVFICQRMSERLIGQSQRVGNGFSNELSIEHEDKTHVGGGRLCSAEPVNKPQYVKKSKGSFLRCLRHLTFSL